MRLRQKWIQAPTIRPALSILQLISCSIDCFIGRGAALMHSRPTLSRSMLSTEINRRRSGLSSTMLLTGACDGAFTVRAQQTNSGSTGSNTHRKQSTRRIRATVAARVGKRRLYFECNGCEHARTEDYVKERENATGDCPACKATKSFGPARVWFRPVGFAHSDRYAARNRTRRTERDGAGNARQARHANAKAGQGLGAGIKARTRFPRAGNFSLCRTPASIAMVTTTARPADV